MSRTTPLRKSTRFTEDRDLLHRILDESYVAHLGLVVDGEPRVLPMFHVRLGEQVYVHGSTGGRFGLAARSGAPMRLCFVVTLLDGLVLAKSQFSHSANYRSVVVHGVARVVCEPSERDQVLAAFVDKIASGRSRHTRPPSAKEIAQTVLFALDLNEVSVKVRTGGPNDDEEDRDLPFWSGVVPLSTVRGVPQPAGHEPLPEHLLASPWLYPATMSGSMVRLEPLNPAHAADLFANSPDPEVWSWLGSRQPSTVSEMTELVSAALANPGRVAWAQIELDTGQAIGTTSYYDIDTTHRRLTIGHTWLGKPWWRTGINSESKLLLLHRAFDELGANRVSWHTDNHNTRSQTALERLGATLEGVIRRHRVRPDGTLRDTYCYGMTAEEWPAVRTKLESTVPAHPLAIRESSWFGSRYG